MKLTETILGHLIMQPALLERLDIRAEDFPSGPERQIFEEIQRQFRETLTVDFGILAERLRPDIQESFVASLLDGVPKTSPENLELQIREVRRRVLTSRVLAKIERQAKSGELDLDEIRPDLEVYDRLKGKAFDPLTVLKTGSELQALDIQVDWTVAKLIPERAITLLHGPGGGYKTWLTLGIAKSVDTGTEFLGLATKQRPVIYIDFENPWPMLIDRVRRLDIRDVRFWHLSAAVRPPKLDGPDWTLYKSLPPGSLLIIDTARSCHDGDENSSQDVALVMNRLKEIREKGNDILLLHHTTKINERSYKGSTAWVDLADNVLSLHRVRRGTFEEIDDDGRPDPDAIFSLGTGEKTRFAPMHLYLTFDPIAGDFTVADDPDKPTLDALMDYINGPGQGKSQSEIVAWAKEEIVFGRISNFLAMLSKGEREGRWHSRKDGRKRIYEPTT